MVFNIQKYSVHDGPGIRTVVFLKGCPLRCQWCSNPESHRIRPQLAYNPSKCITISQCGQCLPACPEGAVATAAAGRAEILRDKCNDCLACVEACPSKALIAYGEEMTADQVVSKVEEDTVFYSRSGGGLTLGGGEPMFQPGFSLAVLEEARRRRIKCAMETCGHCRTKDLLTACRRLQALLFDIKTMDETIHKKFTGVSNKGILENLAAIKQHFADLPVLVRTPVVPGVNDNPDAIRAIAEFIRPMPRVQYELLPFHRLGRPKYEYLGRRFPMAGANPDENRMRRLDEMLAQTYPELLPPEKNSGDHKKF